MPNPADSYRLSPAQVSVFSDLLSCIHPPTKYTVSFIAVPIAVETKLAVNMLSEMFVAVLRRMCYTADVR